MRRFGQSLLALTGLALATPAMAAIDLHRVPAGVVVRGVEVGCVAGESFGGCDRASTDLDLMFVDPGNPDRKASTASFSIDVDAGSKAMVTAYDASGRLLGVADRSDAGDHGERLTVTGLGDIARVHISGRGPIAVADLSFDEVTTSSRLPEPATWAMLITGFLLTAAMIRSRIRRSEARFTARIRQMTADIPA